MRRLAVLLAAALALPAAGQEQKPKKPAPSARHRLAHSKPTPQQIRKFNELEKKEAKKPPTRGRSPK